ncbi:hypothetical protein [Evansella tamaricis]|uniref:Uncharacterized protein n=1 Tax=Evansella tamaricis TaxID=2069301 RepID=A0ABS6JLA6_9BACI|nr:hypothetical protein [Evansella tamaricis]MBU9714447.1 hypothetical protein [Evansella tamaricis]
MSKEVVVIEKGELEKMLQHYTRQIEVDLFRGLLRYMNRTDDGLKLLIEEVDYIKTSLKSSKSDLLSQKESKKLVEYIGDITPEERKQLEQQISDIVKGDE